MRHWSRLFALFALALAYLSGTSTSASTEKRVALVIGNSAYRDTAPLRNPSNDADDVARLLQELGFATTVANNLDKFAMDQRVREFAANLPGADIAIFFYAGHGLQYSGRNYLVPVDAKLETAAALDFEVVPLDLIQRQMEREAKIKILVMDACRNNPLVRNLERALGQRSATIGRGMAPTTGRANTLISFSTEPDNVALDGEGSNSPFAIALLRHIRAPCEELTQSFKKIRRDVMTATRGHQIPWEHSALLQDVYLSGSPESCVTPSVASPMVQPPKPLTLADFNRRPQGRPTHGCLEYGSPLPDPVDFQDAAGRWNLALLRIASVTASSLIDVGPLLHQIEFLNDGWYGNCRSWIPKSLPAWLEVDLQGTYTIERLGIGSERKAHYRDREISDFTISVSQDGRHWRHVYQFSDKSRPVRGTRLFDIPRTTARFVRMEIPLANSNPAPRVEELEIWGRAIGE